MYGTASSKRSLPVRAPSSATVTAAKAFASSPAPRSPPELTRDAITRLWFMNCKACGSARSVAAIKAGFHATAKGD
jgi:hypothetical protein